MGQILSHNLLTQSLLTLLKAQRARPNVVSRLLRLVQRKIAENSASKCRTPDG